MTNRTNTSHSDRLKLAAILEPLFRDHTFFRDVHCDIVRVEQGLGGSVGYLAVLLPGYIPRRYVVFTDREEFGSGWLTREAARIIGKVTSRIMNDPNPPLRILGAIAYSKSPFMRSDDL